VRKTLLIFPIREERDPECAVELRDSGSYFLLAVRRELLAEGQLDNDLLALASDQGGSTTNSGCQEVK
jgi:hypothetical protein